MNRGHRPAARAPLAAAALAVALLVLAACSNGRDHGDDHGSPAPGQGMARSSDGLSPLVSRSCHPGVNAAEFWIVSRPELRALRLADPAAVRYAIKTSNLYILEPPGRMSPAGQTVEEFRSYAAFRAVVATGGIPPTVHWVMYDNERWPRTPASEQADPLRYEALFASLAHRHGYQAILAPAQDLVPHFSKPGFRAGHEAWRQYLSMGLAAASARLGDIYEIQAQPYEMPQYRRADAYRSFVGAAVAQARAANRAAVIFVGLSTLRAASPSQLLDDFLVTRRLAAGFWLNIPGASLVAPAAVAGQFLRRIPAGATGAGRTCATVIPTGGQPR